MLTPAVVWPGLGLSKRLPGRFRLTAISQGCGYKPGADGVNPNPVFGKLNRGCFGHTDHRRFSC